MDKPSSSRPPQKASAGRRVRLIPSTPRPEGTTPPSARPVQTSNVGIPQPPETFGGDLYSNIIREAMDRLNREEMEEEEKNSTGSSSEGTNPSEAQTSTTSSSSLRFSDGRTFEEIASEVIRRMREAEREGISGETQELREPERVLAEDENRVPQEDPIREILDLTRTEEEEVTASGDWRTQMENTVNQLLVENAEQNAMLRTQREQLTQLVDIVDRMISCREEGTQASRRPLPASSIASQNKPSRHDPEANLVGTSRKRKSTATTSQTPSTAKRTKQSGSPGSQKEN